MKLKLKKLIFDAGRPIAFIHEETAKKMNAHPDDRIEIQHQGKHIISPIDTVRNMLKPGEIGFSQEILAYLPLKQGTFVDVHLTPIPLSTSFITKKMQGRELSKKEISIIIQDIVRNALSEAEIAYFVSAVYEQGMSLSETIGLTEAVYTTGKVLRWPSKAIADKHSIGGIAGNRTTPIVVSIVAAVGVIIPKTSSRAITSAAGTADVMETITHVDLPADQLQKVVKKTGACLIWGGSLGLAPADDKLIRVEKLLNVDPESQLIASILAKKLAVGSTHVLLDIPYGPQAKVTKAQAIKLKKKFLVIGKHFHLHLRILLTNGSEPIGNGIGPVLEMIDVLKVLQRRDSPQDLEEKSLFLAGEILEMMNQAKKGKGLEKAKLILDSGKAYRKFQEIIKAQGKHTMPKPGPYKKVIPAIRGGRIKTIENHAINHLGRILGCPIDKASGLTIHKHSGELIKIGEPLLTLYAESQQRLKEALKAYHVLQPIKF